jgi:hypothetical protein
MLLSAGEDAGIQPSPLAGFQVGGVAIARIGNQRPRQLADVSLRSSTASEEDAPHHWEFVAIRTAAGLLRT